MTRETMHLLRRFRRNKAFRRVAAQKFKHDEEDGQSLMITILF